MFTCKTKENTESAIRSLYKRYIKEHYEYLDKRVYFDGTTYHEEVDDSWCESRTKYLKSVERHQLSRDSCEYQAYLWSVSAFSSDDEFLKGMYGNKIITMEYLLQNNFVQGQLKMSCNESQVFVSCESLRQLCCANGDPSVSEMVFGTNEGDCLLLYASACEGDGYTLLLKTTDKYVYVTTA